VLTGPHQKHTRLVHAVKPRHRTSLWLGASLGSA
jgi:hypothetical protein